MMRRLQHATECDVCSAYVRCWVCGECRAFLCSYCQEDHDCD